MTINLNQKKNLWTYLALMIIALIGIFYGRNLEDGVRFIRVWDFGNLALMLLGVPFLFLLSMAGIPEIWDASISNRARILIPLLIGMFFGILDIFIVKVLMHPQPYTELPPFLQPFPYSIFLFVSGAFEIEVFYRLIPLTLILLIGKKVKTGSYYNQFMWFGIIATSIREPIEQFPDGNFWFVAYSLITGFAMNFIQARMFIRYGFMATSAVRLGHYLLWHIFLGTYVEFIELH